MTPPAVSTLATHGAELAVYDWPGEGPPVLLVHAAGFHGRCWDQVVAHLPGRHCVAFDFPGHGHSSKPAGTWSWPALGEMVVEVARVRGLGGAVVVGHSMGGYAVALAAAIEPALFSALLLVDPVIFPPGWTPGGGGGAERASRRRSAFASPAEMIERFRDRHPFDRWEPQVLVDYCVHGLLPAPDGDGFVLACDPVLEAEVYSSAQALDRDLSVVTAPVHILRARSLLPDGTRDMTCSPTDPALAARFPHGTDLPHPELGHHMPMEVPAFVAGEIARLLPRR